MKRLLSCLQSSAAVSFDITAMMNFRDFETHIGESLWSSRVLISSKPLAAYLAFGVTPSDVPLSVHTHLVERHVTSSNPLLLFQSSACLADMKVSYSTINASSLWLFTHFSESSEESSSDFFMLCILIVIVQVFVSTSGLACSAADFSSVRFATLMIHACDYLAKSYCLWCVRLTVISPFRLRCVWLIIVMPCFFTWAILSLNFTFVVIFIELLFLCESFRYHQLIVAFLKHSL